MCEIIFGYINFEDIKNEIFSIDNNEVIKNFDILINLLTFMKTRLFSNFNQIFPLTFDINTTFEQFVETNYKGFTDYFIFDD